MKEKAKLELNEIIEKLILPEVLIVISFADALLKKNDKIA